jgi:hypothetical protein
LRLLNKTTVVTTGVAMLMALGASSAMANRSTPPNGNPGDHKVTICHHTHSASNPWVEIRVDENGARHHLAHHDGDFVVDSTHPCPPTTTPPPPPPPPPGGDHDHGTRGCSSENSSENSTGDQSGLVNVGNVSVDNLGSNGLCQANVLDGATLGLLGDASGGSDSAGSGAKGCSSENSSENSTGDQHGLVNVGNVSASNLGSNLLCQASIANNLTAAVLGTAVGGGDGAGSAHGCSSDNSSENETGTQSGLVNVGNVSVDNLGSNLLCQASIANNLTAGVLGTAVGGSGTILGGGDGTILSSLLGGFVNGDASVLAHLGLIF